MYYKIHNSQSTKILFHAQNQRYNLIRPMQIILPVQNQSPNTGTKTVTTLANPRNTIKGSFVHALRPNYHSLKLLLPESLFSSRLTNHLSLRLYLYNAIERAYILIYRQMSHDDQLTRTSYMMREFAIAGIFLAYFERARQMRRKRRITYLLSGARKEKEDALEQL